MKKILRKVERKFAYRKNVEFSLLPPPTPESPPPPPSHVQKNIK
jgi:hypothetical protein